MVHFIFIFSFLTLFPIINFDLRNTKWQIDARLFQLRVWDGHEEFAVGDCDIALASLDDQIAWCSWCSRHLDGHLLVVCLDVDGFWAVLDLIIFDLLFADHASSGATSNFELWHPNWFFSRLIAIRLLERFEAIGDVFMHRIQGNLPSGFRYQNHKIDVVFNWIYDKYVFELRRRPRVDYRFTDSHEVIFDVVDGERTLVNCFEPTIEIQFWGQQTWTFVWELHLDVLVGWKATDCLYFCQLTWSFEFGGCALEDTWWTGELALVGYLLGFISTHGLPYIRDESLFHLLLAWRRNVVSFHLSVALCLASMDILLVQHQIWNYVCLALDLRCAAFLGRVLLLAEGHHRAEIQGHRLLR